MNNMYMDLLNHDEKFRYMLLDRMKLDCLYYLGNGNRNPKNLWADEEARQIEAMETLWNSFPEDGKPEWLTWEQIQVFAKDMGVAVTILL